MFGTHNKSLSGIMQMQKRLFDILKLSPLQLRTRPEVPGEAPPNPIRPLQKQPESDQAA